MTDTQIFEPDGRAIPFVDEGDGPVKLVLIQEHGLAADVLSVVGHYLAEEAGFHVLRIGHRADAAGVSFEERVADALAVIDHVGLEDTWFGGHGFGGTVARALVAAHPDRANGLLLLGVEGADIELPPHIPVLIIQGTDDTTTPAENAERLRSSAPERASIKTVEGDHLFPMTHPIDTAGIIEEYLDWD
ncbi:MULTISPECIES: alpha/beta fold hydrolase [Microbacterium]|uniref:alpha/beta fold hydrolase n=1 Tax=Microbacterium TaxID=33882 RepID=UPI00217D225A|nr:MULTISPECIES: alpha/beta hydrolase [Microbacterium]UWF78088.1 alpha/beta hydrolase [Microbacterium neungamense]WCM56266.1 alpha/beta hydrolase [Microbacterium sp. EF45047]